jgi:hypothetical protein
MKNPALAAKAPADRHASDVEADPADWPAWTDEDCWVPTDPGPGPSAEDATWWASESARRDAEDVERNAAHAGSVGPMAGGLIPPDPADSDARTLLVGHPA